MDGYARSFVPKVKGNPTFVLEVYPSPNFDLAHEEVGRQRISMRDGELKPVPQNYVRSLILKSEPGTRILIETDNGSKASGVVPTNTQLKVPRLYSRGTNELRTTGELGCRITDVVIYEKNQPSRN